MTDLINDMIEATIGKEGRYSNNKNDSGGETCWGITIAVARANGYMGPMADLPRPTAVAIYRSEYLVKPGFGVIAAAAPRLAAELFDTGVNMGVNVPALWLQEWLNAFNNGGSLYPDIKEDAGQPGGGIGPTTLKTLGLYMKAHAPDAEAIMIRAINCSQGARYKELARSRVANETFIYGWLRTRVTL